MPLGVDGKVVEPDTLRCGRALYDAVLTGYAYLESVCFHMYTNIPVMFHLSLPVFKWYPRPEQICPQETHGH